MGRAIKQIAMLALLAGVLLLSTSSADHPRYPGIPDSCHPHARDNDEAPDDSREGTTETTRPTSPLCFAETRLLPNPRTEQKPSSARDATTPEGAALAPPAPPPRSS